MFEYILEEISQINLRRATFCVLLIIKKIVLVKSVGDFKDTIIKKIILNDEAG